MYYFLIPSAKSGNFVKTAGRECPIFVWGTREIFLSSDFLIIFDPEPAPRNFNSVLLHISYPNQKL